MGEKNWPFSSESDAQGELGKNFVLRDSSLSDTLSAKEMEASNCA